METKTEPPALATAAGKKMYSADERRLVETTRAVMEVIEKQRADGAFDEYLEYLKKEPAKT